MQERAQTLPGQPEILTTTVGSYSIIDWLVSSPNSLRCDHLVLEMAHRPDAELGALRDVDASLRLGIGVIDVKVNTVETPEEVARRIERAVAELGRERVRWVHPDCGLWMLKRSVADRKLEALVLSRNLFLGM